MENEKNILRQRTKQRYLLSCFRRGLAVIQTDPKRQKNFLLLCVLFLLALRLFQPRPNTSLMAAALPLLQGLDAIILILCALIAVLLFGYVSQGWEMYDDLTRAGIINFAGEAPFLIDRTQTEDGVTVLTFFVKGIAFDKLRDAKADMESALNCSILKIEPGKDNQTFVLHTVPAQNVTAPCIPYQDAFMPTNPIKMVVGIDAAGRYVYMNLDRAPHWLLGSVTGGGKTNLLRLILHQMRQKGFDIYLADFKGVDFPPEYRQPGRYAEDYDTLLPMLDEVVQILDDRRAAFAEAGCNKLADYNDIAAEPLPYIAVVIDETSVVLDSTGRGKQEKEAIATVTERLLRISRLGRAMGIHLVLSTQRCDVSSIPGSVKANLPGRLAGYAADLQSSMVLLDDGSAAKLPAIPGRFILRDACGEDRIFQAYFFKADDSAPHPAQVQTD